MLLSKCIPDYPFNTIATGRQAHMLFGYDQAQSGSAQFISSGQKQVVLVRHLESGVRKYKLVIRRRQQALLFVERLHGNRIYPL